MPMSMMDVGIVRVPVRQRFVPMQMRVRLLAVPREVVRMPMMLVGTVAMRMNEHFVHVLMLVTLAQVQPYA